MTGKIRRNYSQSWQAAKGTRPGKVVCTSTVQQQYRWIGDSCRSAFEVANPVAERHGRFYQVSW